MRSQLSVSHPPVSRISSMLWYSKIGGTGKPYMGKYQNNVISSQWQTARQGVVRRVGSTPREVYKP
jgi:hypothetical protein